MKDKFCIHISGQDDIIPVANMAEAVRASAYLNAEYLAVYQSLPDDGMTPFCFAAPSVWHGIPKDHETLLKEMTLKANGQPHWLSA